MVRAPGRRPGGGHESPARAYLSGQPAWKRSAEPDPPPHGLSDFFTLSPPVPCPCGQSLRPKTVHTPRKAPRIRPRPGLAASRLAGANHAAHPRPSGECTSQRKPESGGPGKRDTAGAQPRKAGEPAPGGCRECRISLHLAPKFSPHGLCPQKILYETDGYNQFLTWPRYC